MVGVGVGVGHDRLKLSFGCVATLAIGVSCNESESKPHSKVRHERARDSHLLTHRIAETEQGLAEVIPTQMMIIRNVLIDWSSRATSNKQDKCSLSVV